MKSTKTVLVLFTTYISNKLSLPSRWDVHHCNANHPFPNFLFWMQQKFSWFLWDFRYLEASNDTMIIAYYPWIVSLSNLTMWLHELWKKEMNFVYFQADFFFQALTPNHRVVLSMSRIINIKVIFQIKLM